MRKVCGPPDAACDVYALAEHDGVVVLYEPITHSWARVRASDVTAAARAFAARAAAGFEHELIPPVNEVAVAEENAVFEEPETPQYQVVIARGKRFVLTHHVVTGAAAEELFWLAKWAWVALVAPPGTRDSYASQMERLKRHVHLPEPVLREIVSYAHLVLAGKIPPPPFDAPLPLRFPSSCVSVSICGEHVEVALSGVRATIPLRMVWPEDLALESVEIRWRPVRSPLSTTAVPLLVLKWTIARRRRVSNVKRIAARTSVALGIARAMASGNPADFGVPLKEWTQSALAEALYVSGVARTRAEAARLARLALAKKTKETPRV